MTLQVPIASKLVVLVKLPRLSGIHSDIEIGENYYGQLPFARLKRAKLVIAI